MKIGELARAAGVNTKTVRYYEEIGVLPPARRDPNGYRNYDGEAVGRLRFVRDAQATGLTLDEIISVLELRQQGASTCGHVLGLLEDHLGALDRHISQLQATRDELAHMIQRGQRLDPADCTDPTRCQTIGAQAPPSSTVVTKFGRPPHAHSG